MATSPEIPSIDTDVLIVGAGPAGASLACFLGFYGVKGIVLSRNSTTSPQPRAHYTNPGAWECLRDIGLEEDWRDVSIGREYYGDHRHCNTLAGKDYARMWGFGRYPALLADYETVSPCAHGEVGQNVGEPILLKYATQHGFQMRFDNKFLRYDIDHDTGFIISTILDLITGSSYQIVSKYLCGADGGSGPIARQAELPFHTASDPGNALNVWYKADLTHLHKPGDGLMHSLLSPEIDAPGWAPWGMNRAVKPYTEFVMSIIAAPGFSNIDITEEQVVTRLRELIGDPNIDIEIIGLYRWRVNDAYAKTISKDGKIFCLGDAIHRHPPSNGLGSNTCIQDSYNLAWKLAHVLQGKAGPHILESYNAERQPVGKRIVGIANDAIKNFGAFYKAMGLMEPTVEARIAANNQLGEATPEGAARRAALKEALVMTISEKNGLGAEMNQAYNSDAIYSKDESHPNSGWKAGDDGVREHVISTYPGSRLPHAWLSTARPGEKVSTHDIAGKGCFSLFTGVGGKDAWQEAANTAMKALNCNVKINVRSIGHGQDYTDRYGMWEVRRGVEDDGAVLVRPDRTVAWRSQQVKDNSAAHLTHVMREVLALRRE